MGLFNFSADPFIHSLPGAYGQRYTPATMDTLMGKRTNVPTWVGEHITHTVVPHDHLDVPKYTHDGHRLLKVHPGTTSIHVAEKDHPTDISIANNNNLLAPYVSKNRYGYIVPLKDTHKGSSFIVGDNVVKSNPSFMTHAGMITDPRQLINHLWGLMTSSFNYVVWDYSDFVAQFSTWDGTMLGLMSHMNLIWRTMITVLITIGLIELVPVTEAMVRVLTEFGYIMKLAFNLGVSIMEEVWSILSMVMTDLWKPIEYVIHKAEGGSQ